MCSRVNKPDNFKKGRVKPMNKTDLLNVVVAETGCKNLDEFLTVDVEKIFQAWQKLKKENMKYAMVASPCVDGELLTKSPLTAMNDGDVKDINYGMKLQILPQHKLRNIK